MKFHYDQKADALSIRFNEKRYAESDEVAEGIIFDYDRQKKIIGIEVLEASKRFPKEFNVQLRSKRIPASIDLKRAVLAVK